MSEIPNLPSLLAQVYDSTVEHLPLVAAYIAKGVAGGALKKVSPDLTDAAKNFIRRLGEKASSRPPLQEAIRKASEVREV